MSATRGRGPATWASILLLLALGAFLPAVASASVPNLDRRALEAPTLASAQHAAFRAADVVSGDAEEPTSFVLFDPSTDSLLEPAAPPRFRPLQDVSLLDTEPRRGPPPSYPETRVWAIDFLGSTLVSSSSDLSLETRWACADFLCGPAADDRKDPLGLWGVEDAKATVQSLAGLVVGLAEANTERIKRHVENIAKGDPSGVLSMTAGAASRIAAATRSGGAAGGFKQASAEASSLAKGLPVVGTVVEASKVPTAYETGNFEGGRQVGKATESALVDATVVFGAFEGIRAKAARGAAKEVGGGTVGAKEYDPLSGPVEFEISPSWTPAQVANAKEAVGLANRALEAGQLSPTGRVSTKGSLRRQSSSAAHVERNRAEAAGQPYQGVVGHGPDTTWTGKPVAPVWQDQDWIVNSSLGAQARRYPIGYKPTQFILDPPAPPAAPPKQKP